MQQAMIDSHGTMNPEMSQALLVLSGGVMPVWVRHLATSRVHSEQAVTQMLQAFADINPHIHRAERQAQQITEALSQSDGGITKLTAACERALEHALADAATPEDSKAAMRQVLGMVQSAVAALDEIAKPFSHETQMVATQVERMYIAFQFQDRISQMMALLESDIARMHDTFVHGGLVPPSLQDWLAQLEAQYAMKEQRQNHGVENSVEAANSNETTFF